MDQKTADSPQAAAGSTPTGPARLVSRDVQVYYANCAMVATSPRDISVYFGRFTPVTDDKGSQQLAELYERQVYMTVEQAEDLMRILGQTVQAMRSGKAKEPSK
jgi:hypothetical protein